MKTNQRIILASASPRRRELLENCGISFEVLVTNTDEEISGKLPPDKLVLEISKKKAHVAVSQILSQANENSESIIIIAADTIVSIGDEILGKPADLSDAKRMIKLLEGRAHSVYTGMTLAFINDGDVVYKQDVCSTEVRFKPLTDQQIQEYVNTGEPLDKAGAYAIQGRGSEFIQEVHGDYNNVIGLPTQRLLKMLEQAEQK